MLHSLYHEQVTGDVLWEAPQAPMAVTLDDAGTRIMAEPEDNRVMPSRSMLQAGAHPYWILVESIFQSTVERESGR